jgi:CRP-like cAMP-binding protein
MNQDGINQTQLKSYFQSVGFSIAESGLIAEYFQYKALVKGDLLVKEGTVATHLGFVEKGLLQYFSLTEQGEEKTTYISLPNTFVASLLTYLSETPARESIRALTNVKLWVIEKEDVITLQKQIAQFKDFYIQLIEWQICCIDKAKFDLITLTAEQRYEKLLRDEPELLQLVPLQFIASMLGISPRHLSRLRKNL